MDKGLSIYYTYAYLRVDRTPYYVGKGKGRRMYSKSGRLVRPPGDTDRIILLKKNLSEREAFLHEKYMIHVLGRIDLGTGILRNRTNGGEGSAGRVLSEESIKKMSKSLRGRVTSPETRKKLSESLKGKNLGRKHTLESRRKMSRCRKGRKHTLESRRKRSESVKGERNPFYGRKHTSESRARMSENSKGSKNPNYGKPKSPEVKAKISASNKGQKRSPETCKKLSEIGKGRKRPPEVCKKISAALTQRTGEKNPNYGKSWWHNPVNGQSILSKECPGEGWERGRGNTLKDRPSRKWWNNGSTAALFENDPGEGWKPGKK